MWVTSGSLLCAWVTSGLFCGSVGQIVQQVRPTYNPGLVYTVGWIAMISFLK